MSSPALKIGSEDITRDIEIPDSILAPAKKAAAPQLNVVSINNKEKELEQKVKELEAQKNKIIQDLNQNVILKNAKIHEDLRKVMQVLLNETKKIAPLEKSIQAFISKPVEKTERVESTSNEIQELNHLLRKSVEILKNEISATHASESVQKNEQDETAHKEIQELNHLLKKSVESLRNEIHISLDSVKEQFNNPARQPVQLSYTVPESHTREVEALSSVVKECTTMLTRDFDRVTSDIRPLLKEKAELLEYITSLKGEFASKENQLSRFESDKRRLEDNIEALRSERAELEAKQLEQRDSVSKTSFQVTHLEEVERGLKERIANLEAMDKKHSQVKLEMVALKEETEGLVIKKLQVEQSISRMEKNLKSLGEQYHSFETENLKVRVKLDNLRNEEMELVRSCADYEAKLTHFKSEVEASKVTRDYTMELQAEAQKYFEDRRAHYLNEISHLDEKYNKLSSQLEAEISRRKAALESEFKVYSDEKDTQLKAHMETLHQEYMAGLSKKQSELMEKILELSKKQFERQGFATVDQKTAELKLEMDEVFQTFFNTVSHAKKNWKIF